MDNKKETIKERNERHTKEILELKEGWENELQYAIKHKDEEHEKYCKFWIEECINTLEKIKNY